MDAPPQLRGARKVHVDAGGLRVDLVQNAQPLRYPANLREEEIATAVHQTLAPIFLGERQPDDAFFTELNTAVQGVLDRPMA